MGRDARKENFLLKGTGEESKVFWRAFSLEWDHGVALEQPLGAVAMSADRALPHIAPSANTASF